MALIVLIWALGFSVSIFIGSSVVKRLNYKLRRYVGFEENVNKLTPTMGCIERAIYTLLFYLGGYSFMSLLFGLMAGQKILSLQKIEKDPLVGDRLAVYKEIMVRTNVYFISSFVSLFFGILGGLIIKYLK